MAYDQNASYEAPRRTYNPQQQTRQPQQYQQDYGYTQQHFSAQEEYGNFNPYAQEVGSPYGDVNGGSSYSDVNGYGQTHTSTQSRDQRGGYSAQQEPHQYGDYQRSRSQEQKLNGNGQRDYMQEQRLNGNGPQGYTQEQRMVRGDQRGYTQDQRSNRSVQRVDNNQEQRSYAKGDQRPGYTQEQKPNLGYVNGYGSEQRGNHTKDQPVDNRPRQDSQQQQQQSRDHARFQPETYTSRGPPMTREQAYMNNDQSRQQSSTVRNDHVARDFTDHSEVYQDRDQSRAYAPQDYGRGQQRQDERRYDPRYQQRPGRADTQNITSPAASISGSQSGRSNPQGVMSPVNSTFNGQSRYSEQQQPAPRNHTPLQSSNSAPVFEPQAHKKMTMQEWKAQEKARLHKDARRPEQVVQDNAFPTFPTKKSETARGQSAMSMRSDEHTRPSTASSVRQERPPLARNQSSQTATTNHDSARPSLDHKFEPPQRPSMDSQRVSSPLNARPQTSDMPPRKDSYSTTSPERSRLMLQTNSIDGGQHNVDRQAQPYQSRPTPVQRPSEQPTSPLGKFAQSVHPSTVSDVYGGYHDEKPASTKMMSRDEEIEAEMPDFDSATHNNDLKKRRQTIDQHLNPAVIADAPPLPQQSGSGTNFDFGFQQEKAYAPRQYQPDLARPVQPFAQAPERRSMDDGRQGTRSLVNGRPPPQRFYGDAPQRPDYDRQATTLSDPGMQRGGGVPPLRPGTVQPLDRVAASPINPDALPAHPTPVRAGLVNGGMPAARPAPVRNYNNTPAPQPQSQPQPQQRAASSEVKKTPITHAELQQLRTQCEANPQSLSMSLLYAKKLVEASKVLASEGGRADPKTTAKNRERYIMEAYKRIKKLTSGGYPEAQFYLADCYGQGMLGLEIDPKEAFKLYQAAAKAGHATAAYRTAVCCEIGPEEGGGTSRDLPRAVQWYRRAAALGETAAMFKVGMIALKGLLGQPRNLGEAVTWLKRAAEKADRDNPHALHELAVLYESANSTPEIRHKVIPDDAYALSLYRQAADLGAKHSQFRLGQAYEYGQLGLPFDHRSSIAWYSKAAAQGEHQAELALSGWYLTGAPGILEHSDTEAYLWARKAAQAEPPLAKAMFAMGYFLETGIGCAVNLEEAKRWYGRAASYKHPKALERLEAIKRGVKGGYKAMPTNAKQRLTRKDQKVDEEQCSVM